jgi:hypothetical protein
MKVNDAAKPRYPAGVCVEGLFADSEVDGIERESHVEVKRLMNDGGSTVYESVQTEA